MMVRMFHWNEWDVYRFYNVSHEDYPNLPPPPNPQGLQAFMLACLDQTISQLNEENSDGKRKPRSRPARGQM